MDKLFVDVKNHKSISGLIDSLNQYANSKEKDIYLLAFPKSDISVSVDKQCFMIMSSGYKITIVNNNVNDSDFANYKEDVLDALLYLFQKYDYRKELGRFKQWSENLLSDAYISELENIDEFWRNRILKTAEDKRNSQLLISLCTGSINDINRVKAGVPGNLLDRVKQRIQLFDADQTHFIYQDLRKKVIKIQGLSGTGKTELLLHKLKGLYTDNKKYRIFLTCHNKILADSLKNRIPKFFNFMKVNQQIEWNERLWCANAWGGSWDYNSGLYAYICRFYNIPYHAYSKTHSFDVVCKEAVDLLKNKTKDGSFKFAFDYVLIDECQDFKPSFIELCKLITSKKVYLAGDIFQSIFSDFDQKDYEADYFLSKCYRTDPKTLMISQSLGLGLFEERPLRWLSASNWEACGYTYQEDGLTIKLSRRPMSRFSDENENIDSFHIKKFTSTNPIEGIIRIIKDIKNKYGNVCPNDICVIMLDNSNDIYEWANMLEWRLASAFNWRANKAYETKVEDEESVLISNRNNVKGLEYPFVICVTRHIGSSYEYRNALYTMLSRSFLISYLVVSSGNNGITQEMLDGIKGIIDNNKMIIKKPSKEEIEAIETRFTHAQNTMRKPFDEIIAGVIDEMGIPKDKKNLLQQMILTNFHWEDLSEEELRKNIQTLTKIM